MHGEINQKLQGPFSPLAAGVGMSLKCVWGQNERDQEWEIDPSKHQQLVTVHLDKRSPFSRPVTTSCSAIENEI